MSHSSILNSVYGSAAYIGNPNALTMVCNPIPLFHVYGIATGLLAVIFDIIRLVTSYSVKYY
jgi:hypothetical protein